MSNLSAFIEQAKRAAAKADANETPRQELSELLAKAIRAGIRVAHSSEGDSTPFELKDYVYSSYFILADLEGYSLEESNEYLKRTLQG